MTSLFKVIVLSLKMSDFHLISASSYALCPGFELRIHQHACYQLEVIESGRYEMMSAGGGREIAQGDAIWIAPYTDHGWRAHGPVRAMTFRFESLEGALPSAEAISIRSLKADPWLLALPTHVIDAWSDDAHEIRKAADELLTSLWRLTLYRRGHERTRLDADWAELMRTLRVGTKSLSIEEMAARVHLSPTHFRRRFRIMFNESAARYARRKRLVHARELLALTSLPLAQVAEQAGYADPAAFNKAFKRHFGCTPASIR